MKRLAVVLALVSVIAVPGFSCKGKGAANANAPGTQTKSESGADSSKNKRPVVKQMMLRKMPAPGATPPADAAQSNPAGGDAANGKTKDAGGQKK